MRENEITDKILNAAIEVHRELGPGLLESVYETVLALELGDRGLNVRRQVPIPVRYKDVECDEGFRADMIVEGLVLIELKSVKSLDPIFAKQTLTYLRFSKLKLGLLINFNETMLRNGIKRLVNGLEEPVDLK